MIRVVKSNTFREWRLFDPLHQLGVSQRFVKVPQGFCCSTPWRRKDNIDEMAVISLANHAMLCKQHGFHNP